MDQTDEETMAARKKRVVELVKNWAGEEGIELESVEWNPDASPRESPQTLRVTWIADDRRERRLWKCPREPVLVDEGQETLLEAVAFDWFQREVLPNSG